MYIIRLTGYPDRYLGAENYFVNSWTKATRFANTSGALQAIHDRGHAAGRNGWPTGTGTLQIVEVVEQPFLGQVIA